MVQELKIKLDDQIYKKLKKLCMGEENAMKDYVTEIIKEKINQPDSSSNQKNSLENYLKKGQSGSRNYGVKGQGW